MSTPMSTAAFSDLDRTGRPRHRLQRGIGRQPAPTGSPRRAPPSCCNGARHAPTRPRPAPSWPTRRRPASTRAAFDVTDSRTRSPRRRGARGRGRPARRPGQQRGRPAPGADARLPVADWRRVVETTSPARSSSAGPSPAGWSSAAAARSSTSARSSPSWPGHHRALHRGQRRPAQPHPGDGCRVGRGQRPGQLGRAGLHPHRDDPEPRRRPGLQRVGARSHARRALGLPADLVGPTIWLASDASGYVNGQTIFVDGGMTAVV